MDKQYIDKHEAYMLIEHEAETHELPASKEAYERAARIVDQMRPEELDISHCSECDMEISNVKITDASLTMADHGCLTFFITVEGGGIGVSIGGYCIGHGYLGAKEFKSENGIGLVAMMKIMDVVGVTKWEDLKGKYCRIKSDGWGSRVTTIGNILDDKWFDIGEFFKNAQ